MKYSAKIMFTFGNCVSAANVLYKVRTTRLEPFFLFEKLYLIALKSFLQLSLLKEHIFKYILCHLCLFSRDVFTFQFPALTQTPATLQKHLL